MGGTCSEGVVVAERGRGRERGGRGGGHGRRRAPLEGGGGGELFLVLEGAGGRKETSSLSIWNGCGEKGGGGGCKMTMRTELGLVWKG